MNIPYKDVNEWQRPIFNPIFFCAHGLIKQCLPAESTVRVSNTLPVALSRGNVVVILIYAIRLKKSNPDGEWNCIITFPSVMSKESLFSNENYVI